ncbi:MAG: glycosyl transferase [Paraprevotella sp.]|nr:glycosyl transferase [Paraprevotella sp.]MBP3471884.1 glycosyl transferase [Paraprevotella sp.]
MIPQIIHYCWFGHAPLPTLALKCMASWKKYLPDYEIRLWDESTFDISSSVPYVQEAYRCGRYAFVTDYVRFWALERYGGMYFDTDVEVLAPLDDILDKGAFLANEQSEENKLAVAPGLGLAFEAHHPFLQDMLAYYQGLHFVNAKGEENLVTVVSYTTRQLLLLGAKNNSEIQTVEGIFIYPPDYFCPKNKDGKLTALTKRTKTIHHYTASWKTPYERFAHWMAKLLGKRLTNIVVKVKHIIK